MLRRLIPVVLMLFALMAAPAFAQDNDCIDLNTASFEELRQILHVDAVRAEQIIELREEQPFESVDDLVRVDGFNGDGIRLQETKDQRLACVNGETDGPMPRPSGGVDTGAGPSGTVPLALIGGGLALAGASAYRLRRVA